VVDSTGRWELDPRRRAILEAVVSRLIPADAIGPGALEAGAATYIERALSTDYAGHREEYLVGLDAVNQRASSDFGDSFVRLCADEQDALLAQLESDAGSHPERDGAAFFELVLGHTFEGMFGDPVWGGNAGRIGWKLMGYAGPKRVWSAHAQQLDVDATAEQDRGAEG
jgi:gluconate 2-dehydrogenase gamma chain